MNNFLLINPRGELANFYQNVNPELVDCYVVNTNQNRDFLTDEQRPFYKVFTPDTLPEDVNFVSAISNDALGFDYLEKLNSADRILFANDKSLSQARIDSFLLGEPTYNVRIVEVFGFYGRYVTISGWDVDISNYQWTLLNPTSLEEWDSLVDRSFNALEHIGYINGPAQIFFNEEGKLVGIKFQPLVWLTGGRGNQLIGRHWADIWPTLLADKNENNKGFFKCFYEWSRSSGNVRKYIPMKDVSFNMPFQRKKAESNLLVSTET